MQRPRPSPTSASFALSLLSIVAGLGCASASKSDSAKPAQDGVEVENPIDGPVAWNPDQNKDQRKIGFILAELDGSLRKWNSLVLSGATVRDAHSISLIEHSIAYDAAKYQEEIMDQLITGPQNNRRVAAAALGFSGSPRALAPLLSALSDPDEQVIANALLSLGTLRDPGTPLTFIASLMAEHESNAVRANAGRALRSLLAVNSAVEERADVRSCARRATADIEPAVRMSALLLLAELHDYDSLDAIALALNDPVPLVARAASRSVAHIGSNEPEYKGRAARALAASLSRVDKQNVRPAVFSDLQALGSRNYGPDIDAWIEWANRLP